MKRTHWALLAAFALAALGAHAAAPDTEAVEFYNSVTGHYFVTATASEALGIDTGAAGPGWVRTGRSFQAWLDPTTAPSGAQPVCRFYSSGANSHFYTASASECASLQAQQAVEQQASAATGAPVRGWVYEGTAFYIQTPTSGQCPAGSTQLVRMYNNGFANGQGSNHRFVDQAGLQDMMIDNSWIAEGPVFCATSKSTGTEANLPSTTTDFTNLAGTWTGSARWNTESAGTESTTTNDLSLTVASDGTLSGTGNGCTFTGSVTAGDGFRAFFTGTASATGCTDTTFNGSYPRVRLERFGNDTLMVQMVRDDGSTEASIHARLTNGTGTATTPTTPSTGFASVAGEWIGTVGWIGVQTAPGSAPQHVEANKPLDITISSSGALTGTGFGCTLTGTLTAVSAEEMHAVFTGNVTTTGCDQSIFNGTFTNLHVVLEGNDQLNVELESESHSAQGNVEVTIHGTLQSASGATTTTTTTTTPSESEVQGSVVGAWQGTVDWAAVTRDNSSSPPVTLVDASQAIQFTIGKDGAFAGSGFGCTFTGQLTLSFDGHAVTGGSVGATGCTNAAFNGTYSSAHFEADDAGLQVELSRESESNGTGTVAKIRGTVSAAS